MRRYCLVNELKSENVGDYEEIHKTAHLTHWQSQLEALKEAGAVNCITYIYKNLSILFYECEEIGESFRKLDTIKENKEWQEVVLPWFANSPKFDGNDDSGEARKVFDLKQQLEGYLDEF
jgi:L-rhamnose mutarotase